jgi:hypothetical protein
MAPRAFSAYISPAAAASRPPGSAIKRSDVGSSAKQSIRFAVKQPDYIVTPFLAPAQRNIRAQVCADESSIVSSTRCQPLNIRTVAVQGYLPGTLSFACTFGLFGPEPPCVEPTGVGGGGLRASRAAGRSPRRFALIGGPFLRRSQKMMLVSHHPQLAGTFSWSDW